MGHWRHLLLVMKLKTERFEKTWHHDEQGRRAQTMLRLRNLIMDSIRRFGLRLPQEETQTDDLGRVDVTSYKDTVVTFSGNQAVEAQLYQAAHTWAYLGYHDDSASIPCGSLSPDLGEMWKYAKKKKEARTGTARVMVILILMKVPRKRREEYDMRNVRYVLEGPLCVSVRVVLVPDDVLSVRATAVELEHSMVVCALC